MGILGELYYLFMTLEDLGDPEKRKLLADDFNPERLNGKPFLWPKNVQETLNPGSEFLN